MSACRSCGADIDWVVISASNKRMPLNPHPDTAGTVVRLEGNQVRVLTSTELTARHAQPGGPGPLYTSHFSSCPNANEHRARR